MRLEYKWIVGIVFAFGMFMNLLDATIVNVALPTFAREFQASAATIQWIVTGYLLSLAVAIPMSGWIGDRFGTKRTLMLALGTFTAASFLCALAGRVEALIAFRVLQGIGAGMLTPVGMAILFRAFPPHERAQSAAIIAIPTAVAPASGPVLGGYLVEYQSWPWIFLINIPVGALALLIAGIFLREEKQAQPGRLDVPGFLLSASGLALLLYAFAEAGTRGLDDGRVVAVAATGAALLAAFAAVELRTKMPLIDVRLLRDRLFRAIMIIFLPGQAAFIGALFLLPLLLQAEMGLTPLESGLATFPQAIGIALMAQPAGRIFPLIGPRRMIMFGTAGLLATTLAFLLVDLQTDVWWIRLLMLLRGCAFAFVMVPGQTTAYLTIRPQETGRATAMGMAIPQVAASFGVALIATVLTDRLVYHGAQLGNPMTRDGALLAFHEAFVVASIFPVLAFFAALLLSDKEALAAAAKRPAPPERPSLTAEATADPPG
ncbi:MAG: MDR family MFS transporter [Dehalococcoidia bacterium]|nr:MDR family MFS transporter [Dehalococcoidia bacterium]